MVTQPSLFSADLAEPELGDLAGLLAAHGQITASPDGARLSILLAERWRAVALAAECANRGVAAEIADAALSGDIYDAPRSESPADRRGGVLLRTDRLELLRPLAAAWTRGAVKAAPARLAVTAGFARIWVLAAGAPATTGFGLGLDPHAPATFGPLVAACAAAGIPGAVVGVTEPALRITGSKRLRRLAEMVGTAPAGARFWP